MDADWDEASNRAQSFNVCPKPDSRQRGIVFRYPVVALLYTSMIILLTFFSCLLGCTRRLPAARRERIPPARVNSCFRHDPGAPMDWQ